MKDLMILIGLLLLATVCIGAAMAAGWLGAGAMGGV